MEPRASGFGVEWAERYGTVHDLRVRTEDATTTWELHTIYWDRRKGLGNGMFASRRIGPSLLLQPPSAVLWHCGRVADRVDAVQVTPVACVSIRKQGAASHMLCASLGFMS